MMQDWRNSLGGAKLVRIKEGKERTDGCTMAIRPN